MPINPIRGPTNFDVPIYPAGNARAPEGTFANIASIGDAIGDYRERNMLGEIARSATGPDGQLDINKFATAVALSGRDPTKILGLLEAEARRKEAASYRQEALDVARQGRDIQERQFKLEEEKAKRGTRQVVPPTLLNPGGVYDIPLQGDPSFRAFPNPPAPQSALPGDLGGNLAAVEPSPEEAPPYRVAGPPMPPPTQAAPVEPPAAAAAPAPRNEQFLRRLPPGGQELIKGLADYKIDPAKADQETLAAVRIYRPDWDQSQYQKRGTPPSGEVAGRTGLAKSYLDIYPDIKRRIEADELNTTGGRAAAQFGQGYPSELVGAIKEGAESLLRGLTGAGMNKDEAADYAKRYGINWYDTKETQLLKIRSLHRALTYVTTEVGAGRGGEDLVKNYKSQFGAPLDQQEKPVPTAKNEAEVNRLVGYAREQAKKAPGQVDEIVRRLQQRLPQGMDARMLLGQ